MIAESLKMSHGNYTDEHVRRCSQLVGNVSRTIQHAFHTKVADTYVPTSHRNSVKYQEKMVKFVNVYKRDKLFDHIPGREHSSFTEFRHNTGISRPAKLKARLNKHLLQMEKDHMAQDVHGIVHH
jgi:hypothetical protein